MHRLLHLLPIIVLIACTSQDPFSEEVPAKAYVARLHQVKAQWQSASCPGRVADVSRIFAGCEGKIERRMRVSISTLRNYYYGQDICPRQPKAIAIRYVCGDKPFEKPLNPPPQSDSSLVEITCPPP